MNTERENVREVLEVHNNFVYFCHNYHVFACQYVESRKNKLDNLKIIDLQWQIQFLFQVFFFSPTLWIALFVGPLDMILK
jgi:hypothetical protein